MGVGVERIGEGRERDENNLVRNARMQEAQCPGLMGWVPHELSNWLRRSDAQLHSGDEMKVSQAL